MFAHPVYVPQPKYNILYLYPNQDLNHETKDFLRNHYFNKQYTNDSGFDIICTHTSTIPPNARGVKINLGISSQMTYENQYVGYMLVPRSSTGSKSPLRLSNSIGIIDSGYTGNIIACVDNLSNKAFTINKGEKYFQLVSFNGYPIIHYIVDDQPIPQTQRGQNGFGSTGA